MGWPTAGMENLRISMLTARGSLHVTRKQLMLRHTLFKADSQPDCR